jgi:hypothetical protein
LQDVNPCRISSNEMTERIEPKDKQLPSKTCVFATGEDFKEAGEVVPEILESGSPLPGPRHPSGRRAKMISKQPS